MDRKEFLHIFAEAHHRRFQWVINHKDSVDNVEEEIEYWIAVVAQERKSNGRP